MVLVVDKMSGLGVCNRWAGGALVLGLSIDVEMEEALPFTWSAI